MAKIIVNSFEDVAKLNTRYWRIASKWIEATYPDGVVPDELICIMFEKKDWHSLAHDIKLDNNQMALALSKCDTYWKKETGKVLIKKYYKDNQLLTAKWLRFLEAVNPS